MEQLTGRPMKTEYTLNSRTGQRSLAAHQRSAALLSGAIHVLPKSKMNFFALAQAEQIRPCTTKMQATSAAIVAS